MWALRHFSHWLIRQRGPIFQQVGVIRKAFCSRLFLFILHAGRFSNLVDKAVEHNKVDRIQVVRGSLSMISIPCMWIFGGALIRGKINCIGDCGMVLVCRRKRGGGGLGFRDMKSYNQALLAKQLWHLFQKPVSMAYMVLRIRYFLVGNILQYMSVGVWSIVRLAELMLGERITHKGVSLAGQWGANS